MPPLTNTWRLKPCLLKKWWKLRLKSYEERLKSLDERDEEQGQLLLTNGDYDGRQYKRVRSWGRGFYRSERGRGRGSIEVIRVGLSTMIVKSMDTLEISVQNGKTMKVKPI